MPFLCDQIFIRRNYILPGFQCLQDHRLCRLKSTHHFDHDRDFIVLKNLFPVIRKKLLLHTFTLFLHIPHKDLLYFQLRTGRSFHHIRSLLDQFIYTCPYSTKTEDCNFNRIQ